MNWYKLQMILYGALIFTVMQGCVFNDDFGKREEKPSDRVNGEGKNPDNNSEDKYFIGEICLVQESLEFVLIKSSKLKPRKGTVLHVMSQGGVSSKAKLSVSPERRTGFISADILDGDPRLGDWVFFKLKEKQIDAAYSEEPSNNENNVEASPLNLEQPSED
ncbi:MAG: hypothetical protein HN584_13985 [Akkermansiaceae bacterium]|jgi:hypothetical protein|nr:hypothetical protein [Akkermansiaceae bacterium]